MADDPVPQGAGSPPGASGASRPQSGQPPFGSSPTTNPQASQGNEAAAVARVDVIIKLLSQTLPLAGAASELGSAIMDCIKKLSKYAPTGQVSPGIQQSQIQSLLAKQQQAGPQIAAMRGGGDGESPPPPPSPGQG